MKTLADKIEQYRDNEPGMHTNEGRRGLANLCKIVRLLGYKDPCMGGQLDRGAYLNDLMLFFEDNSGAIEAVVEWIGDMNCPSWNEEFDQHVQPDGDEGDEDED